jgi:tRNA-uridine 2-sulfurtransferase
MITKKHARGLLLYSGGLDSILAARLLLDQDIEVLGLHFLLPFFAPHIDPAQTKAGRLAVNQGLNVRYIRTGMDYMRMLENPASGHGKAINPCIDCKIFFLKEAARIMRDEGFDFVATGEVLGQRPMSQMRNRLNQIEHESGLTGKLLRPLTAQHLPPTGVERDGLVDRSRLLGIFGRGRNEQVALAARYGIRDYAQPAGGCLFTDPHYAVRLADMIARFPDYRPLDVYLLSIGRYFRLGNARMIVSRNAAETEAMDRYRNDAHIFAETLFPGPVGHIIGECGDSDLENAARILLYYGKPDGAGTVAFFGSVSREITIDAKPNIEFIDALRI